MTVCKDEPMVSVIVPVYNAEKYLQRCIDSILSQTYGNFELLLIDDGSTDGSHGICCQNAVRDCRVKVICQENCGVSAARNHGLEEAAGNYLCFVDSDDWIDHCHIEKLVSKMEGCDCVCTGYTRGDAENRLENRRIDLLNIQGTELDSFFANGFIHPCWNKMFRKTIIEENKIRFDTDIQISEDSLFCLEYLRHARTLMLVDACTYHYWYDANEVSLSKKINPNAIEVYEKVYNGIQKMLLRGNCAENVVESVLKRTIFPQLYSTIIKAARADDSDICKRELYEKLQKTDYVRKTLKDSLRNTNILAEKATIFLTLYRQYGFLEYIWKRIIK